MENIRNFKEIINQYEETDFLEKVTFGECLKKWAKDYENKIAVIDGDEKISYATLDKKVDFMASGLKNIGIKKGDNVVVQLPNTISFVIICFALFRLGAVPILARPAHREADLNGIFELARPKAYIIPDKFLGFDYRKMARNIVEKYPYVDHVIVDGINEEFLNINEVQESDFVFELPLYTDIALLSLSGGTTGTPKLIPRTHSDYIYNVKMAARKSKMNYDTIYLAALPVSHGFAFANPGILGTFTVGGTVVMCKNTSPDEILPLIEKERVTITSLVPAAVNLCLETLEWDKSNDISSLEVLLVGGSVLEEKVGRCIMSEMSCRLQQVLGMSEGLICMTSLDDPDEIIVSCQGKPISERDEIKIVDENLIEVKEGVFGELITRGPYTIRGYYCASEESKKFFTKDGFYRTGDKAKITPEGNVVVSGRIKEQINRAGEKIMPLEVEGHLCKHKDIKEAVVIGIPDDVLGNSIFAFLMTENKALTLTDIHEFLKKIGVSRYKMPDQIGFIEYWPVTSVGKIDKKALMELAEKDTNKVI